MITQQEWTPATIGQSVFAQKLGVDSTQMSGALTMFYVQKAIQDKKLRQLKHK